MKTYKHLVFDVDGTLIDTAKINMLSLQQTLKELRGETVPLRELHFSFGIPGIATMERLGLPEPEGAFKAWEKNYMLCAERLGIKLFPGLQKVLDKLSGEEVSLGIITSKTRQEYELDFRRRGLETCFSCAITFSDTKRGKPYPDPMLEYLKRTGAKPEEVLYFGDSSYDMECARGAGVDQALVLWGCLNPEGIASTYRLERVEEILAFAGEIGAGGKDAGAEA